MEDGDSLYSGDLWLVERAIMDLTDVVEDVLNPGVTNADGVWWILSIESLDMGKREENAWNR